MIPKDKWSGVTPPPHREKREAVVIGGARKTVKPITKRKPKKRK